MSDTNIKVYVGGWKDGYKEALKDALEIVNRVQIRGYEREKYAREESSADTGFFSATDKIQDEINELLRIETE